MKQGKSQTLKSKHLEGLAADLGAWINNTVNWDFDHYFKIADAMRLASIELGIKVRWGGAWRILSDYSDSKTAYNSYIAERKKAR